MKVAGDPFPVLEDGQLVDSGEQPSVVDRHPGGDSQADDELLVHVGEHLVARLVGEIEVAEHLVAHRIGTPRNDRIGGWFGGNP